MSSIILFIFPAIPLFPEITVNIIIPELGEGMSELEMILASNIGTAVAEIENMATGTLRKPGITSSCGHAAGLTGILASSTGKTTVPGYSFSLGAYASVYSDTYNVDTLSGRLEEFQPEDDFRTGAAVDGLTAEITLPLDFIHPGMDGSFSAGFLNISNDEYNVKTFSLNLTVGYSPFRTRSDHSLYIWTPLILRAGVGYGMNNLGTRISAGLITESFDMDPDGDGPLIGQPITIEVEPVIDLGLESRIGTLSLTLSTSVSFLEILELYGGAGGGLTFGTTGISTDSDSEIAVLGYLSDLIEEEGSVSISGAIEGGTPDPVSAFIFAGLRVHFGTAFISIPFLYEPPSGISAGISLGVLL